LNKSKNEKNNSNNNIYLINSSSNSKNNLDFENLELYPKYKTYRNDYSTYNVQPIEDITKIKQSYKNLEKINNDLNLLNKNLISENNKLKLQIINYSTNIYNNPSNEKKENNINKESIKALKNKIIKTSKENEILKNNNNNNPDEFIIEQYNRDIE
jgi:predicted RNase H-like nuclease (RuvC/YqgF family)